MIAGRVPPGTILAGASPVDNFEYCRTGHLKANVCMGTGILGPGIGAMPGGLGSTVVREHPKPGAPIEGFRLPQWPAARELVARAAWRLSPIRTVGWDVALAPEGSVLVEGNVWGDPSNDLVIGPQAADARGGGMAVRLPQLGADAGRCPDAAP